MKNLSNKTITESNEDHLSFTYFNQDLNENINMDVECGKNKDSADMVKNEKACLDFKNNEYIKSSLSYNNMEYLDSTKDKNLNFCNNKICNEKESNKHNFGENIDYESYSSKENLDKTNAEILSNESVNEKTNNKSNIDLNLNLNENDNLSVTNADFNPDIKNTNLDQSMKLEDETNNINNTNSNNKTAIANRRRGRQKKNIRNKKMS